MSWAGWLDAKALAFFDAVSGLVPESVQAWIERTWLYLWIFNREVKVVLLGLDNAGKTTLMQKMTTGRIGAHFPTQIATKETCQIGSVTFNFWDVGGHDTARVIWREYYMTAHAVVFMVDAFDPKRFAEAKQELDKLLSLPEISGVPFLVLGNKIDKPDAVSEQALRVALGLMQTTGKRPGRPDGLRPLEVFMISANQMAGIEAAFTWLKRHIDALPIVDEE